MRRASSGSTTAFRNFTCGLLRPQAVAGARGNYLQALLVEQRRESLGIGGHLGPGDAALSHRGPVVRETIGRLQESGDTRSLPRSAGLRPHQNWAGSSCTGVAATKTEWPTLELGPPWVAAQSLGGMTGRSAPRSGSGPSARLRAGQRPGSAGMVNSATAWLGQIWTLTLLVSALLTLGWTNTRPAAGQGGITT